MSPYRRGVLFALLAVLLWSGNFIIARALHGAVPPVALAFWRWCGATIILLPFAGRSLWEHRGAFRGRGLHLVGTSLTGITLFNTFIYIAGREVPAIHLALIGTTASPLFVLLLSFVFLRERLPALTYMGALLCLCGLLVLITGGRLTTLSSFRFSSGDLWIVAAGLSFALYTLQVRRRPAAIPAKGYLLALIATGTLLLLPAYLWEYSRTGPFDWTASSLGSIGYLAICTSVLAFLLWNEAIRRIGPSRTALFGNGIPILSAIEAVWILEERVSVATGISFALIALGLLLASFRKSS